MLRRRPKQSNARYVGIFNGKEAKYDLGILETLLHENNVTAYEIAKNLQKRLKPTNNREIGSRRTQNIYSVIQRKNGRLNDLKNKGYVSLHLDKWNITLKGWIALNIEKPDLVRNEVKAQTNVLLESFRKKISSIPDDRMTIFGIQIAPSQMREELEITPSQLKERIEKTDPAQILTFILAQTKALIAQGIQLDTIREEELFTILALRMINQSIGSGVED